MHVLTLPDRQACELTLPDPLSVTVVFGEARVLKLLPRHVLQLHVQARLCKNSSGSIISIPRRYCTNRNHTCILNDISLY